MEVLPLSRLTISPDGSHDRYLLDGDRPLSQEFAARYFRAFIGMFTGELEAANPGWRMDRPACVNVRSEDCAVVSGHIRSIVNYRGEEYSVIGLYFAHDPKGRLELHYVLSTLQDRLQLSERTN